MRRFLILLALAGCADSIPIEAAQAAVAACVPHDGLNSFEASENVGGYKVTAYCKNNTTVIIQLKRKARRYDLMT